MQTDAIVAHIAGECDTCLRKDLALGPMIVIIVVSIGTVRTQWPVTELATIQRVAILAELQVAIAAEAHDAALSLGTVGKGPLLDDKFTALHRLRGDQATTVDCVVFQARFQHDDGDDDRADAAAADSAAFSKYN